MEFIIYFCPIIVILYIINIITKFSGIEPYEHTHIEYYRDKNFTEYSPLVWGYILNKKFKKETVTATILLYVKKGFISMTKIGNDYEFKIIKDLKEINQLDLWAMGLFFINGSSIGNIQHLSNFNRYIWIEKNFVRSNKFQKEIEDTIKKYLNTTKVINYVDEEKNKKNIIFSYVMIIITLILSAFLSTDFINAIAIAIFFLIGYSLLITVIEKAESALLAHGVIFFSAYFCMGIFNGYSLILLVTALLTFVLIYIDDKIIRVKGKNGEVIEKAFGLKRYIKDFSNIKKYSLESVSIWDEYYIYSIALGINKT